MEELVLVVQSTINSLATPIFEVSRNGRKIYWQFHPTTTKADGHLLEYFRNTFLEGGGGTEKPPTSGLTASGGNVISDSDG